MKDMRMIQNDKPNLMRTAIELFLGEHIDDITVAEESVVFTTMTGATGIMEPNFLGNFDIWIGEEVIYEIEHDLFKIMLHKDDKDIFSLYDYLRAINIMELKHKSKLFLYIVKTSVERLLLHNKLDIEGRTIIGTTEVIYHNGKKLTIMLN